MRDRTTRVGVWRTLVVGVAVFAPFATASIAGDPYLDALESEASETRVDPASRPDLGEHRLIGSDAGPGTESGPGLKALRESLPPGLSRRAFEAALEDLAPSVYALFRKLDSERQQQVYEFYQVHRTVEQLRTRIVGLLVRR